MTKEQSKFFKDNGYLVLKDFFTKEEVGKCKKEMTRLVNELKGKKMTETFRMDMGFESAAFFDSADKTGFFLERDALDEKGELKYPIEDAINKAGHGMHDDNPVFSEFSYSDKVKAILRGVGYIKPILVQSMYIMKGKRIGGAVSPHCDNTYIRSSPSSCVGIWVAIDKATPENGGLYGVPGSHRNKTEHFMKLQVNANGERSTYFNNEKPNYSTEGAVSLEADVGTVVLLHGDFVHFSPKNTSTNERHAYTMHFVESANGTVYEKDNWLQRPAGNPFKVINL